MPEPWDRPPIPTKGDENNDSTYSAVGRVLTQWERVEVELAHLYACFKGQPTNSLNQIREYGSGTIFRERAQKLADAAHSYFRANCCQHHEGDFDALMRRCLGFSARRNDVAHGVVDFLNLHWELDAGGEHMNAYAIDWALFPPHYDPKRHTPSNDPEYAYSSSEMNPITEELHQLRDDVWEYVYRLFRREIDAMREALHAPQPQTGAQGPHA